ncbi:MAG: hypothetical protein JNM72_12745 [Deltaproteobacteria bacterium]|nr:hypothetical protein [Deltaproteobacteria bacterium]
MILGVAGLLALLLTAELWLLLAAARLLEAPELLPAPLVARLGAVEAPRPLSLWLGGGLALLAALNAALIGVGVGLVQVLPR